jgi:hypothetical protein
VEIWVSPATDRDSSVPRQSLRKEKNSSDVLNIGLTFELGNIEFQLPKKTPTADLRRMLCVSHYATLCYVRNRALTSSRTIASWPPNYCSKPLTHRAKDIPS